MNPIRAYLDRTGETQKSLAERVGVKQPSLNCWTRWPEENGTRPDPKNLRALATAIDVPHGELLEFFYATDRAA